jgi:para-nitrobenzyl esterase
MMPDMAGASAALADAQLTSAVETASGRVRGLRSAGVSRFLGIPYGDDTAKHRFQPPRIAPPWAGTRDCFHAGAQTVQGTIDLSSAGGSGAMPGPLTAAGQIVLAVARETTVTDPESEDCLFLNVWTPDTSEGKRPVMVWLHGGGWTMGQGLNPMTDGANLARTGDVVVVSMNHRLNALGYLYLGDFHPDFADSGNAGQLDIILALQWVRDNIANFGGDPGNVTIFGQSGGGMKVSALLGTLPAKGLFHKAIAQSGAMPRLVDRASAIAVAEQALKTLGVTRADVHRLQAMDAKAVIAAALRAKVPGLDPLFTTAPVVDGRSVPADPFDPVATAISRDVPLMIGTARDENTMFLAFDPAFGSMSTEEVRKRFAAVLGARGDAAFALYRQLAPGDPPTYWLASMLTDMTFRAPSLVEADSKAKQGSAPVFMYRVDYQPDVAGRALRSSHGTEMPLVFGNYVPEVFIGTGAELHALGARTMRQWIAFARSGDPSIEGAKWPRYDTDRRLTMLIDVPGHVASDPDQATRKFWNA